MNFEFYDEREKHTKDTRLKISRSSAPYFRKFLEGKHQGTPNLKILRSRHKKNSRTLWIFTRTPRTQGRTPNLKFLENQNKFSKIIKRLTIKYQT